MSAAAAKRVREKPFAKATAKRKSTAEPEPDEHGLWVNWDFLRNLTKRAPRTILQEETPEQYSRYLKLADLALGPVERRKSDQRMKAKRPRQETASTVGTQPTLKPTRRDD